MNLKHFFIVILCISLSQFVLSQNTLSATYTSDIPTSLSTYDNSCNGSSTILSLTLPEGDNYTVTNVTVSYNMNAQGSGWKSHQRSAIKFQNAGVQEADVAGVGDVSGVQMYSRSISLANGSYPGGTILIFQMLALRTAISTGCSSSNNRVDANTWSITVHYNNEIVNPKVGVNTTMPSQTMHVAGKLKLGDDTTAPQAGTARWNATSSDFEGYNGTEWISFTKNKGSEWGDKEPKPNVDLTASDGAADDLFGYAVSISGDYAIVGAYKKEVGTNPIKYDQGKAYIFKRTGTLWSQEASIVAIDGAANDYFGFSVSISGDYAIVGAKGKDVGTNPIKDDQGKAYIFKRTGTSWNQEASMVASDGATNDEFGYSVSISGDYAIVGTLYKDIGTNLSQGKAYIYKRTGTSWNLEASILASDGAQGDVFGNCVSISGYYAIVGARGKDVGTNTTQGKAYIFKRSGTLWSQEASIVASDGAEGDVFGFSVSISGDYSIVGAVYKDIGTNINQGKAYIYKRTGTSWSQEADIVASDGAASDNFGYSVSITGGYAIVGAWGKNVGANTDQGKAYMFRQIGTTWVEQTGFVHNGSAGDEFGTSVAIDGNHSIVGTPNKDVGSNVDEGKIYIFSRE